MVGTLQGAPREVFSEIYQRNIWGLRETVSGAGSTLRYTEKLRQSIPGLIADLNIRTLLDVPCGDFHWMSEIETGRDDKDQIWPPKSRVPRDRSLQ